MSEIRFTNETSSTVWVAVMFYSPDGCAAYGMWGTRGWWRIEPGATAFALRTNNRYAGYYAESANGKTWSGDRGPVYVYQQAFDSCIGIGSTAARTVNMRLIDTNGNNLRIRLTN
ncbi:MAG TPA: DUF1036 domain-containing protein [Mycobacterium sp.]|nr:DUF1036 domain-containing protein [Mycobacterium sp.]